MQVGLAEIAILCLYLASLRAEVVTLIAGCKRPSLLMAGNNDEMYDKKPQRYAKHNVTQL